MALSLPGCNHLAHDMKAGIGLLDCQTQTMAERMRVIKFLIEFVVACLLGALLAGGLIATLLLLGRLREL